jgi:hypothetical protein
MKICGWQDLKTMQRYIRMAGIDEQGATEGLNLLSRFDSSASNVTFGSSPDESADQAVMNQVVSLLEFKVTR